jgi:hypothetical protein
MLGRDFAIQPKMGKNSPNLGASAIDAIGTITSATLFGIVLVGNCDSLLTPHFPNLPFPGKWRFEHFYPPVQKKNIRQDCTCCVLAALDGVRPLDPQSIQLPSFA